MPHHELTEFPNTERIGEVEKLVLIERARQQVRWGDVHDNDHDHDDWVRIIQEYVLKAYWGDWKERMIQVAALAIAAVEAERRHDEEPDYDLNDEDDAQVGR